MRGLCRRTQRKMTRPEVARYLTIATSAPQAPGSQKEQHRVKRHAQNTRATFRSHFRLRKAQHLSTPTIDTHHSHRSKPQRTANNLPNLKVSTMRVHRNRAGRRFEHHTIANRQSDPQNAARSPQNGLGAPEAQRSSETPPFQYGNRNENRPGPNFKVSTMRSHQHRLEPRFEHHAMVNRQCVPHKVWIARHLPPDAA